jgi:hypothetical protein
VESGYRIEEVMSLKPNRAYKVNGAPCDICTPICLLLGGSSSFFFFFTISIFPSFPLPLFYEHDEKLSGERSGIE